MTWVRIDDHFDEHPKLAEAGIVTWGVWMAGIAYCNRNLTDGFIPWTVARSIGSWELLDVETAEDGRRKVWDIARACGMSGEDLDTIWIVERLVAVGLWEQVDGGYRIHDYTDYQPTKAEVMAEREKVKGRVADWRKRKKPASNTVGNADGNGVSNTPSNGGGTDAPVPVPGPVPLDIYEYSEPTTIYLEKVGRKPGQKELNWLEDLHVRYSRTELVRGMMQVPKGKDYLKRLDAFMEGAA